MFIQIYKIVQGLYSFNKYKKNNKILNGFGFSCNIDSLVELV